MLIDWDGTFYSGNFQWTAKSHYKWEQSQSFEVNKGWNLEVIPFPPLFPSKNRANKTWTVEPCTTPEDIHNRRLFDENDWKNSYWNCCMMLKLGKTYQNGCCCQEHLVEKMKRMKRGWMRSVELNRKSAFLHWWVDSSDQTQPPKVTASCLLIMLLVVAVEWIRYACGPTDVETGAARR